MNKIILLSGALCLSLITAAPALSIEITSLDPARVKVGWEGTLTINGKDLGEQGNAGESFVAIGGLNVLVQSWTPNMIQAFISKTTTTTAGEKRLVVDDKNAKFTETKWTVE